MNPIVFDHCHPLVDEITMIVDEHGQHEQNVQLRAIESRALLLAASTHPASLTVERAYKTVQAVSTYANDQKEIDIVEF